MLERDQRTERQNLDLRQFQETAKEILAKVKSSSHDAHLLDEAKIAVRDFMSFKTFKIKTFEDLSLALFNIHEIIQHPLLSDELRQYGASMLASIIEALIREEGALQGLNFIQSNLDKLPASTIREVLPELTNPFLVAGQGIVKEIVERFVSEMESMLATLIEGENPQIRAKMRDRINHFANEIKSGYETKSKLLTNIRKQKRERQLLFWILFILTIFLFLIFFT